MMAEHGTDMKENDEQSRACQQVTCTCACRGSSSKRRTCGCLRFSRHFFISILDEYSPFLAAFGKDEKAPEPT